MRLALLPAIFAGACIGHGLLASPGIPEEAIFPLRGEITVMNTLSTPQFYGPSTLGFHHGLDLLATAGTPIYAPVSGQVAMGNYYPQANTPYTYEVSIQTEAGNRWELHHIDPATIPETIHQLAQDGGTVEAGTLLGAVFDATVVGVPPHLHINVLNPGDYYLNPRQFLPALDDDIAPTIRGIYLVDAEGLVVTDPSPGPYELVVDVVDQIPPSPIDQSIYHLEITSRSGQNTTHWRQRFDQLPTAADFISGATDSYRQGPITLTNGTPLASQFSTQEPRRFFHRLPIQLTAGETRIQVRAADFNGNQTEATLTVVSP